ncbi:hypothetical protein H2200_011501 [Cladophialophora chaetospira]|uniref:Circumsporozoite protein n=1 Tax=Cladophialophora chaetospira TaxID=386627 RepID=A0AA39CD77_9EURO|nr:hypothetical protein H2200_011501 [Cladophialophora chaetospira]
MFARTSVLAALLVVAQARFNQEQIPIPAIAAVQGGSPGVAQTIAGAAISDLLAASNACNKLKRGDQIISELGTGADAIAAAIGIVAAEKNFNPFVQSIPTICSDPTLPASDVLRGITPLIDPAVVGSDIANALSEKSKATPLDATGKSVADLLAENGFTNFTSQAADGSTNAISAGGAAGGSSAASTNSAAATSSTVSAVSSAAAADCGAVQTSPVAATAVQVSSTTSASATESTTAVASGGNSAVPAGVDFGKCIPTMKFEDPLVALGQQEALNPNIITNRICDQLINVCSANDAAHTLCKTVQAQVLALGTRDKSTADFWNTQLGFEGTVTNPDGGNAEPPAKMRVVRSYRGSEF